MSDIHSLSGAYAIDALDDVERARFERHLAECADCRAEVESLRETAALLPETTAAAPPASLRGRVLDEIGTVRPLPPVTEPAAARSRRRRLVALVAAAAAIVAIGAVGVTVWSPWSDESSQGQQPSAVERVLQAKDAESFRTELPDGSAATITRSVELNQAVIVTDDMTPAPEGKVYEVWLFHGDEAKPAALMPPGPDNAVLLDGDPATAIGAGITVEPAGGSSTPSAPPVVEFDFG